MQNALATVDWRLDERLTLSGGAGYAWLATNRTDEPAKRTGLPHQPEPLGRQAGAGTSGTAARSCRRSGLAARSRTRSSRPASSDRSPAASTGARARQSARPIPLTTSELGLRSVWARSSLSYLATRWLRVEGFYVAVFQDSRRPGGHINRSRAGIQVVTTTRTRIR